MGAGTVSYRACIRRSARKGRTHHAPDNDDVSEARERRVDGGIVEAVGRPHEERDLEGRTGVPHWHLRARSNVGPTFPMMFFQIGSCICSWLDTAA